LKNGMECFGNGGDAITPPGTAQVSAADHKRVGTSALTLF